MFQSSPICMIRNQTRVLTPTCITSMNTNTRAVSEVESDYDYDYDYENTSPKIDENNANNPI